MRIKQLDSGPLERGGHLQVREQYVTSVNASCTNHSEFCVYVSFLVLVTGGDVSKLWLTKCGVRANITDVSQSSVSLAPAVSCRTFFLLADMLPK